MKKNYFLKRALRIFIFILMIVLANNEAKAQFLGGFFDAINVLSPYNNTKTKKKFDYSGFKSDTLQLTLNDALEIATNENLTIQIADQEIERQEYAKKGTYADLFPQISASGTFQRTLEKQTMYMDDIEGMDGGIKVGRDNNWTAGFSASMPLVDVSLWKSLQISAKDVELAVEKARSSQIDMVDQVKKAFYMVLLAQESVDVYRDAYNNAVQNYADIEQKFGEGLVSEYDLIRANVNVKNAEPNVYDAENSLIIANWQLKALLGLNLDMKIGCVGSLTDYEETMYPSSSDDIFNLSGNSDLRQLDIQYAQLGKTRQMQVAKYYPTLNASFSYQWNAMNNDFKFGDYSWDPYSVLGVTLSIPIFTGGKRTNTIRQTNTSIKQLELQRLDAERELSIAARQSSDQMNTCIKQYTAARAGVAESNKSYAITIERYNTGAGTLLEINDAQLSLTQARLNLNQAIYNYLIAESTLDKTLGKTR